MAAAVRRPGLGDRSLIDVGDVLLVTGWARPSAATAMLALRGRTVPGVALLMLIVPFMAAPIACATQGGGVWFQ